MYKSFWDEYSGIIGLFALSAACIILLSSPGNIFEPGISGEMIAKQMIHKFGVFGVVIDLLLVSIPLFMIIHSESKTIKQVIKKSLFI